MWTEGFDAGLGLRRILAIGFVALVLVCAPAVARAQGCCVFGSSLTPTRLDLHERALVGLQLGGSWLHGSNSASAQYRGSPPGTTDVELRQTLFATVGIGSRVQASVLLPWVETFRSAPSTNGEWGQGLGDISGLIRADLIQLHEFPDVPSVALVAGAVVPTGTPAEEATHTLGSDTTGTGVYRALVGVSVEQAFGAWLASATGTVAIAARSTRASVSTHHAPRLACVGGVGYAWSHQLSTALSLLFETEARTEVDGTRVPNTQKRRTELSLITTYSLDDTWRAQFRLGAEPPLSNLGRNEPARLGGNLALVWSAF